MRSRVESIRLSKVESLLVDYVHDATSLAVNKKMPNDRDYLVKLQGSIETALALLGYSGGVAGKMSISASDVFAFIRDEVVPNSVIHLDFLELARESITAYSRENLRELLLD